MNDPQPNRRPAERHAPRHYLAESLAPIRLELGAEARSARVTKTYRYLPARRSEPRQDQGWGRS